MRSALHLLAFLSILLLSRPAAASGFFAMDNALGDLETLAAKSEMLARLGYDGVTWRPGNTAEALKAMNARGIRMHALMMTLPVSKEDKPAPLPLADIEALRGTGAILWVQLLGKGGGDSDAVRELRRLNAVARPLGLRVAIYPHVNNHVESLEDALRVAKLLDDDNVGVSLTLCHQLKSRGMQDLAPLLKEALPKLFLVLVAGAESGDTRKMGWDQLIQPLGQGSYDVGRLLGLLRQLDYTGPVGVIGYGLRQPAEEHLSQSIAFWRSAAPRTAGPAVLRPDALRDHVRSFNRTDHTHFGQAIANDDAAGWMLANVPLFECPDPEIEEIYHFRWWTFRKHIRQTDDGYVVTEFLPKVSWSGKHNTISCPAGHHFREGRWIRDRRYLDDYAVFWFRKGGAPRRYSFWAADSIYQYALARGDFSLAVELLPDLVANYGEWEKTRLGDDGLFWQIDDRDGMEVSVGGSGHRGRGRRPTINSYMYGDARAIAAIATRAARPELAERFQEKAERLRELVQERLWDDEAGFFKVLPLADDASLVDVRELHGYTPWYFELPEKGRGFEKAWRQLVDPQGFRAPFGPTTAERRHPGFQVSYTGHECQWNGPSWPFATSVTLTALANVLHAYPQDAVTRRDYFETLRTYTRSHRLKRADGSVVPWIDENLNPDTGDWIARTRLRSWKNGTWDPGKGGIERGKDYNHSTYCDLIITGLVGLRPRADEIVEVHPLVPAGTWDWFCLDGLPYHGRSLTILYDRTGGRYQRGAGLQILADGQVIGRSASLNRLEAGLPTP